MLAGYPAHLNLALAEQGNLLQAPLRTLDLVRTLRGMYGSGTLDDPGLSRLLINSDPLLRGARGLLQRGRASGPRKGPDAEWLAPWDDAKDFLDVDEKATLSTLGPLNRTLYLHFHHTVLPCILRNYDRCSMAHGVESRMPFMDWRLVCYVFGLPETSKVGGGLSKRVLREALRGVLPEKIRTRKDKIGFVSPMPNWFNGGLGEFIWEQVRSPSFVESPVWNGAAIRDFVGARHRAKSWNQSDCKRVWRFVQAHLWRRAFIDRVDGAPKSQDPLEAPWGGGPHRAFRAGVERSL
jgi:hypothetical protein